MTRSKAKAEEANKSVAKRKSSSRPSVEEKQFSAKRVKDEKSSHVAPTATAVVISGAQIGNSPASGRGRRGSTDNADDGPLHEHYAFYESFRNGRLQEFRNLDDKTRSRIVRQAIQQSPHGVLNCLNSPDCTKSCKSALGAKYHLERCGNQNEQPTTSNTPDAENQSTYLQYKNKLDEWKALSMEERNKIMRKGLLAGPMPCLRATECSSTFTSFSGLRYHLEHCEKPGKVRAPGSGTALTPSDKERLGVLYDSYKGKMPEWRQLDAKERTRIVRAAMAARGALHCLGEDCDTQSSHAYGLGYHLDRCGLTDQEKPWKCYRCGHKSVVANSRDHLDECVAAPPTVKREGDAGDEAGGGTQTPPPMPGVRRSAMRAMKKFHSDENVQRAIQISDEDDDDYKVDASDDDEEYEPLEKVDSNEVVELLLEAKGQQRKRGSRTTVSAGKKRHKFKFNDQCMRDMKTMDKRNYKQSVNAAYLKFLQENDAKVSTVIKSWKCSAGDWRSTADNKRQPPQEFRDKMSITLASKSSAKDSGQRVRALTSTNMGEKLLAVYCGGPIAAVAWCPRAMSDDSQVVAVAVFTDEEVLMPNLSEAAPSLGFVQLWKVCTSKKNPSLTGVAKVLLETEFGQVLNCCWCPVGFDDAETADGPVGALAVATVSGHVPIFCVPNRFDSDSSSSPSIVRPTPQTVLVAPSDNEKHRPPIQSLAWCPFDGSNLLAGVVADGRVVVWDLQATTDGQPTKVLFDEGWLSAPVGVVWLSANQIAISFREKVVRAYELDSLSCVLEEMGVRTAGSRLASCPSIFPGIFTFQSEQVSANGYLLSPLNYISLDTDQEGFFVVPLLNRHHQPIWDVAVSSYTGLIASVGGDGLVVASLNGRVNPLGNKHELASNTSKLVLSVTTERINQQTSPVEKDSPDLYCTFDACINELRLRVNHECDEKDGLPTSPADQLLTTYSSDLPMASLTCAAFSSCPSTATLMCAGGQAGLLFFFDADIA